MSKDTQIAALIAAAQSYSDWAKFDARNRNESCFYYSKKTECIQKALDKICASKSTNFKFALQGGVVYFSFKLNNVRYQVSFHDPHGRLDRYYKNSSKTHWDRRSSREAAELLKLDPEVERLYRVYTRA